MTNTKQNKTKEESAKEALSVKEKILGGGGLDMLYGTKSYFAHTSLKKSHLLPSPVSVIGA